MKATYKECDHLVGRVLVHLLPGQFVFGRRVASEQTGLNEGAIRCAIKTLINLGNLAIKSTNKFSIITVVKWGSYQSTPDGSAPADVPADVPADAPTDEPQREKKRIHEEDKKQESAPPAINDTWNEMAAFPRLPKVKAMTAKRKATLRTRWADPFFRENWAEAMAKVPGSPFLIGQNDRGWQASFDWFLRPDTVAKILEGTYDGTKAGQRAPVDDSKYEVL